MFDNVIDFLSSEYYKYRIEEAKFHELASFIQTMQNNLFDNMNKTIQHSKNTPNTPNTTNQNTKENTKEKMNKINDLMDSVSDRLVDVNAIVIYLKETIVKNFPDKSDEIIKKPVEYTIDTKFKEKINAMTMTELKKETEKLNTEMIDSLFNQEYNEFIEIKQKLLFINKIEKKKE